MNTPHVTLVYQHGTFTLPEQYKEHNPDRLASTPGDNLAEFAGRLCYASVLSQKGRITPEYHEHILATKHHSVYAHAVETFEVTHTKLKSNDSDDVLYQCLCALQSRPGVWVTEIGDTSFRFCLSLRAVIEWHQHGPVTSANTMGRVLTADRADRIYSVIYNSLVEEFPLTLSTSVHSKNNLVILNNLNVKRVKPRNDKECWVSLYIEGVSRDLLQELVRHHYQTNPSVRSTRYVDEGFSTQILHPAIPEAEVDLARDVFYACKESYRTLYAKLIAAGVDTKTARGAARSLLPGATETKMVFSLSRFQAKHLLSLRANSSTGAVDPEILRLARAMREILVRDAHWDV